jgi:mono/diheme cytochrome c family protein
MKTFLLLCVLGAASAMAGDKKFELRGVAAKGEAVYKTYCILCHGERGDGTGHIGRGLSTKPVNFTDPANAGHLTEEFVYRLVKDGAAAHGRTVLMIPWEGILKEDELRNVTAYALSLVAAAKTDGGVAAPKK